MHFLSKTKNLFTFILVLTLFSAVQASTTLSKSDSDAFIGRFYQNILGKTVAYGGLMHWNRVLQEQSIKEVAFGFLNTKEYLALNLSDSEFIGLLYQTIFNKTIDSEEKSSYLDSLNSGVSRENVVVDMLDSQAFADLAAGDDETVVEPDEKPVISDDAPEGSSSSSSSSSQPASSSSSSSSSDDASSSSSSSQASSSSLVCQSGPAAHEGKVTDSISGEPLSDVEVSIGGCVTTTDSEGFYRLANIAVTDRAVVNFSKNGYYRNSAIILIKQYAGSTSEPSTNYLEYSIDAYDYQWEYDSQKAQKGANIDIPAAVLVDNVGDAYYGTVNANLEVSDITTDAGKVLFPGDFEGSNSYGETVLFGSYGLIEFTLNDASGNELKLETGAVVTLTFNAVPSLEQHNIIPLWYYDFDQGVWVEDGYAELQDNGTYKGEISHLGTWSLSKPVEAEPGIYQGSIVYENENTAKDVRVTAVGPNWVRTDLSTDVDGKFEIKVVPGNGFNLKAYNYRYKYEARYKDESGNNLLVAAVASGEIAE